MNIKDSAKASCIYNYVVAATRPVYDILLDTTHFPLFQMANSIGISALVLSGISFVLAIVETAIPYWTYTSAGEAWVSSGLWKACASTGLSNSACISFDIGLFCK